MVHGGGYPLKISSRNDKIIKIAKNSPKFCKKEKNDQKIFLPPTIPHHKNGFYTPTVKISKITRHCPTGPLPISETTINKMSVNDTLVNKTLFIETPVNKTPVNKTRHRSFLQGAPPQQK